MRINNEHFKKECIMMNPDKNAVKPDSRGKLNPTDDDSDDVVLFGVKLPPAKRAKLLENVSSNSASISITDEKGFSGFDAPKAPSVPSVNISAATFAGATAQIVSKNFAMANYPFQQNVLHPLNTLSFKNDGSCKNTTSCSSELNILEVKASSQTPAHSSPIRTRAASLDSKVLQEPEILEGTTSSAEGNRLKGKSYSVSIDESIIGTVPVAPSANLTSTTTDIVENKQYSGDYGSISKQLFDHSPLSVENPFSIHQRVVEQLTELCSIYDSTGDKWRATSYRKAIARIQNSKKPLSLENYTNLKNEASIGLSIFQSIEDIIKNGSCQRLELRKKDEKLLCLNKFLNVWGIGQKTALSLYRNGIHSIEELREQQNDFLTVTQCIGLKYYEDFNEKIPRNEIDSIFATVRSQLHEFPFCKNILDSFVCGSYRRGKNLCGDIDILLIKVPHAPLGLLSELTQRLHAIKFLTDDLNYGHGAKRWKQKFKQNHRTELLSDSEDSTDSYNPSQEKLHYEYPQSPETYYGVCVDLNGSGIYRRIDIKIYPLASKAFATLYFTGSAFFNRGMRLWAKQKGFRLDDRGMFHRSSIGKSNKSISCAEESDIFQALGLKYRAPDDREVF
ncbi:hypothetical protein IE077_001577 [Cardiosporidium cionae]|uniref:DNA polymerase n=1 Tax=Cardiosporidium cionae TaxID=476202 RepID=A0ABQ7J5A1_9APIC|nr:hypothetical protein IE077_001577 [Cardiosporidium cionae]|eukprot:KAF8819144.1 hypothetical protein IE077_001577 [Cardiosporidium cionae]